MTVRHCDMGYVPFPPTPRGSGELYNAARERLDGAVVDNIDIVRVPDLNTPWVGVRVNDPALCDLRGWLFDIVEPDNATHPLIAGDPLTIVVAQNMIAAHIWNTDDPTIALTAAIEVDTVPEHVTMPADALPPDPWRLDWYSGWTQTTVRQHVQHWFDQQTIAALIELDTTPDDTIMWFGDNLFCSGAAFDDMIRFGVETAAVATSAFNAFFEAAQTG